MFFRPDPKTTNSYLLTIVLIKSLTLHPLSKLFFLRSFYMMTMILQGALKYKNYLQVKFVFQSTYTCVRTTCMMTVKE